MIYYALLAFFVLEYVRPGSYLPALNALHLNSLVPLGVVLACFFSSRGTTPWKAMGERNVWLVFSLLGLIGVSVLTADVTLYAYNVFMTVLGYALITWVLCKQLVEVREVEGILKTLVFVHLAVAALTPEMITNPEVRHYVASGSFLGDGNDFALSVNVALPFCVFLALSAKRWLTRLPYAALVLFLVFCVVATQSRGGTVALGAVGVYYWIKSDRRLATGLIFGLAVVLVLLFAPESYFGRMNRIDPAEGSARGRILAWEASMRMAADHPLLGVGAGHFGVKYGMDYRPPSGERVGWQTAHSVYFLALGELGFPGLFLVLTVIGSNLRANRRVAILIRSRGGSFVVHDTRLLACLSASLIAFASGGAFLSALYYPHIYVLAGLHAAARRLVLERSETRSTVNVELAGSAPPSLAEQATGTVPTYL